MPDVRLEDRDHKLARIVHAEENVIAWAAREGIRLGGASLYVWPFCPCSRCAKLIAATGFSEVVIPDAPPPERWRGDFEAAVVLLGEAGIRVRMMEGEADHG